MNNHREQQTESVEEFIEHGSLDDHDFKDSKASFYGSCPDKCCVIGLRSRLIPVGNFRATGTYIQELYETYHGVMSFTLRAYVVGNLTPLKSKSFEAYSESVAERKWEEAIAEISEVFSSSE